MPSRPRKSSACITLVLIGTAALAGCSDDSLSRRKAYATKEECLADWGDPTECEEQIVRHSDGTSSRWYWGGGHGGGGGWWGGGGSGSSGGGSHGVQRGGFGASGQAHAGGS
jgi:hypothetical protein